MHTGSILCLERTDDGAWQLAWSIRPALFHGEARP